MMHIVPVNPEIPRNTSNIARSSAAATDAKDGVAKLGIRWWEAQP
jgi:tRNA(Leu) C34 or U34 (ribose-2'-O)-methylase TrmL